ncbi:MAG: sigma-70 family RNA polymerase sigma factor [Defluviitaleaceae bacterium]|nr:sigma-70 family RNA polymerase sigma factor [Defluviitaleaceae bacterium]
MEISDANLLAAAKSGNAGKRHAAFENLLFKYEKLLWHVARRYFHNNEDAGDAFQEACVKIYNGLPSASLPESGSLKSWVCAVTSNACLDELRKRKKLAEPLPDETLDLIADDRQSAPSAEDEAIALTRADDILRAIGKLSEDHRTLIILRDMNGLSYQELAETVGVSVNTVKSRLSRAREALHKMID